MSLNVGLLRSSFDLVVAQAPDITHRFYDILFARYPQARPLFSRNSRDKQEQMLTQALVLVMEDRVLTGDTLLIGATGRTDLPTGDAEAEYLSLQRLLSLPGDLLVFPAHDYGGRTFSTIGHERLNNPRLRLDHEAFIRLMTSPRTEKPARLAESLAYNTRPLEARDAPAEQMEMAAF